MHSCSNCGKEVSEDAAHCGHCGHELGGVQKKTIMGLGAVDSETLKERVRQAKAKREARQASEASPEEDADSLAKTELMDVVDLPPPGSSDAPAAPGSSDAPAAPGSASPSTESEGAKKEFVTAPTEAMDTVDMGGDDPSPSAGPPAEGAPKIPSPAGADAGPAAPEPSSEQSSPGLKIGGVEVAADAEQPVDDGPVQVEAGAAGQAEAETAVDAAGQPVGGAAGESRPTPRGPMERPGSVQEEGTGGQESATDVALGADSGVADVGATAAPVGAGGSIDPSATDEGGGSKKIFIIAGVALFFFFGCCVVGPLVAYFAGFVGG